MNNAIKKKWIGIAHVIFSASVISHAPPDAIGAFVAVVFEAESECDFHKAIQNDFCSELRAGYDDGVYHEAELLHAEPLLENHKLSNLLQTSILNDFPEFNFAFGKLLCYDDFSGESRTIKCAFDNVCESENLVCDTSLFTDWLLTIRRRWIATVHVAPSPLYTEEDKWNEDIVGAFVNVVADAYSKKDLIARIYENLGDFMGFPILEISDITLLSLTQEQKITDIHLKDSIQNLLPHFSIAFGDFHCYSTPE